MPRTVRFPIVVTTVVATLLSFTAASALAQGLSQVRAGSEVAVANNGECLPNTDVRLYFEGGGVAEVQVGSTVSDAVGSFATTVVIPAEAAEGPASLLVDCGLDSAVLTYDLEVLGKGFSPGTLVGPLLVGLVVIAGVGLLALLRRRRSGAGDLDSPEIGDGGHLDGDGGGDEVETAPAGASTGPIGVAPASALAPDEAPASSAPRSGEDAVAIAASAPEPIPPAPAPAPPIPPAPSIPPAPPAPVQDGRDDHEDGIDDGADYWFWEVATSAGPRRRVACMTETMFHLHEVSVEAFQPMLDRLVEVGPDEALAEAFVRVPVAAIDRVVREATVVHIEGRGANGPRRQTIDLGDGAEGVVEMLARRLAVVDAARIQEAVR